MPRGKPAGQWHWAEAWGLALGVRRPPSDSSRLMRGWGASPVDVDLSTHPEGSPRASELPRGREPCVGCSPSAPLPRRWGAWPGWGGRKPSFLRPLEGYRRARAGSGRWGDGGQLGVRSGGGHTSPSLPRASGCSVQMRGCTREGGELSSQALRSCMTTQRVSQGDHAHAREITGQAAWFFFQKT